MDESNTFTSAELGKLLEMSKESINGLSYALQTSVKIDPRNNYGKMSFEYVLMLLELISDKMRDEQTLNDFFLPCKRTMKKEGIFMNRPTTIAQFREKYGADALSLEEDFAFVIDENLNALKTDSEMQQREYFYFSNQEYFFQFVDYISAIGKYDEMYFVVTPSTQYYAYSEFGRQNIINHLSKFADDYQARADRLRSIAKEASLTNSRIVGVMI